MRLSAKGVPAFQYLATATGTLNVINSGMQYGWASASLPKLLAKDSYIPTTNEEALWISVMLPLGAVLGSVIAGYLLDSIGRKKVILLSSLPLFTSWMMIAFAKSVNVLISARFVAGLSDGFIFCGLPMYLGEIADPNIRGLLGSGVSVNWILGMFLINIIGSYLSITDTALIASTLPVLLLLTFSWIPESPYYLILKRNFDGARRSLRIFKGTQDIEGELNRLSDAIEEQNKNVGSIMDLFTVKSNRKAIIVIMGIRAAQQFSGTTAIMFYAQIIFKEAGESISPSTSSIIYFGIQLIMCALSSSIVDRFGRKPLMIVSIIGSGIALFVEACFFSIQNLTQISTENFDLVPIIALIFYILLFSLGMQTIPVLMLGEVFSTSVKSFAVCFADVYLAIIMTAVSKFFQATKDEFGMHVPFLAFTICCILGLFFIIYYVPETKGKTLEEIQEEFKGNKCSSRTKA